MIVVHAAGRLARALAGGIAYRVVEDHDPACAQPVAQKLLDLGIVGPPDLVVGVEVAHPRRCLDDGKAVAIETEFLLAPAAILDPDLAWIVDAVPLRDARRRVEHIAHGFLRPALQIVQGRGERLGLGSDVKRHGAPPIG